MLMDCSMVSVHAIKTVVKSRSMVMMSLPNQ